MKAKNLIALLLIAVYLTGCAISKQAYREARLMPQSVAEKIVSRYVGSGWVKYPRGQANLANHPLCKNFTHYPMKYEDMIVGWDDLVNMVTVWTNGVHDTGFWCGSGMVQQSFRFNTEQERNDLIDAFASLGAKVNTH